MTDRTHTRTIAAGVACALLSILVGSSPRFFVLLMYWMLGSTGIAFAFGAAARRLLDSPGMFPRSMKAIARAAEDPARSQVERRTAVALYVYMVGLVFSATAFTTIGVVTVLFLRK